MNEPIAEPAHAVTPAEPTPVVAPREPTIEDLVSLLNTLLRFQAIVEPVRRGTEEVAVHGGSNTRVRRERRERAPEEWIVHIFPGGNMYIPAGREPGAFMEELTAALQKVCATRQQEVAQQAIATLEQIDVTPGKALALSKQVEELVHQGAGFARFGVNWYRSDTHGGNMVCPRKAEVRFRNHATAVIFANELNVVISPVVGPQVQAAKAALIKRLLAKA